MEEAVRRVAAEHASMMDLGAFRAALIAVLERIAVALERANEANPIDAINRALETGGPLGADGEGAGEEDQAWRYR